MKKNDIAELDITDTTLDGSGVGKHDGLTVFVNASVKGDRVMAHILKVKSNCAFAKIEEIIKPSQDRTENDCGTYKSCGGCVLRHVSYEAEAQLKENAVRNNLKRIGGVTPEFERITVLRPDGYRNKCQYPVSISDGKLSVGFFANHSHRVADCPECRLQPEIFSDIVKTFKNFITENKISVYDELSGKGLVRHLYLRTSSTGDIMVCVVINGTELPKSDILVSTLKARLNEKLRTVVLNINTRDTNVILGDKCVNIYGDGYIYDMLCGVRIRISPLSFYQVNHDIAELLYRKAAEFAKPDNKMVVDLYCGAGTIGLSMAKAAKSIIGVEIVPEAVDDARLNFANNGFDNCRFICGDAADAAKKLSCEGIKPDVVILDPPRKGCDAGLIKTVAEEFLPQTIVYVSCDSATLARDCKIFGEYGYVTEKAAVFDMFPRTGHVETVCRLNKL